ncbi:MAG: hypothetical protein EOO60_10920 [Hymenobacter sp.]|nr:MAG: hypothetical protein EOO60_10920 [Hymenobacter sp.]
MATLTVLALHLAHRTDASNRATGRAGAVGQARRTAMAIRFKLASVSRRHRAAPAGNDIDYLK